MCSNLKLISSQAKLSSLRALCFCLQSFSIACIIDRFGKRNALSVIVTTVKQVLHVYTHAVFVL
uniref:Uncharacterized protein n=1 Tax=Arundo donax TaxID=35708 RepID=A0A0A9GQY3_ARUDO